MNTLDLKTIWFFIPSWQMLYTGLIFGPIVAVITSHYGTIWPAVMIHYVNNILAPLSQKYFTRSS